MKAPSSAVRHLRAVAFFELRTNLAAFWRMPCGMLVREPWAVAERDRVIAFMHDPPPGFQPATSPEIAEALNIGSHSTVYDRLRKIKGERHGKAC